MKNKMVWIFPLLTAAFLVACSTDNSDSSTRPAADTEPSGYSETGTSSGSATNPAANGWTYYGSSKTGTGTPVTNPSTGGGTSAPSDVGWYYYNSSGTGSGSTTTPGPSGGSTSGNQGGWYYYYGPSNTSGSTSSSGSSANDWYYYGSSGTDVGTGVTNPFEGTGTGSGATTTSGSSGAGTIVNNPFGETSSTDGAGALHPAAPSSGSTSATGTGSGATTTPGSTSGGSASNQTPSSTPNRAGYVNMKNDAQFGRYLTGRNGLTLYVYDHDQFGLSNCVGECLNIHAPVRPSNAIGLGEEIAGQLGSITLSDGSRQVTYDGMPLYYSSLDQKPGDVGGTDMTTGWSIARP